MEGNFKKRIDIIAAQHRLQEQDKSGEVSFSRVQTETSIQPEIQN